MKNSISKNIFLIFPAIAVLFLSANAQTKLVRTYYEEYDTTGSAEFMNSGKYPMKPVTNLTPVKEEYYALIKDTTVKQGLYKHFSKEGDILLECNYDNNLLEGSYKDFFPGHKLKYTAKFHKGIAKDTAVTFDYWERVLHYEVYKNHFEKTPVTGEYFKYNPQKILIAKGTLLNGKLNGPYSDYYANNQLRMSCAYENGYKTGPFKVYSNKGVLMQEGNYTIVKSDTLILEQLDGMIASYDNEGNIRARAQYKNGFLHGKVTTYFPTGKIKMESYYKNNVQDSTTIRFYENGNTEAVENYKDGRLSGFYALYYPNGNKKEESVIVDNFKNGKFRAYNENGVMTLEGNYNNGILNGENLAFYDDGTPKHKLNYKNGKKTGENFYYYPNGQTKEIYTFIDKTDNVNYQKFYDSGHPEEQGMLTIVDNQEEDATVVKIGEWLYYHPNKKLQVKETYSTGKLNGERLIYDEHGNLAESQLYTFGIKNGLWKTYYPNGNIKVQTPYKTNAEYGKQIGYYHNGQKEFDGSYINGRKTGKWNYYTNDGKISKIVTYKNDIKVSEKEYNHSGK